jgi:hypothetical protein
MAKVGIPPEQRDSVFATVAAVLHLGNVSFVEGKESDSSTVAPGSAQEHLQAAGKARMQLARQQRCLRGILQWLPRMQLLFWRALRISIEQGVPQQEMWNPSQRCPTARDVEPKPGLHWRYGCSC